MSAVEQDQQTARRAGRAYESAKGLYTGPLSPSKRIALVFGESTGRTTPVYVVVGEHAGVAVELTAEQLDDIAADATVRADVLRARGVELDRGREAGEQRKAERKAATS